MKLESILLALPAILNGALAVPMDDNSTIAKRDDGYVFGDATGIQWKVTIYPEADCKGPEYPYYGWNEHKDTDCEKGLTFKSYKAERLVDPTRNRKCRGLFYQNDRCLRQDASFDDVYALGSTDWITTDQSCHNAPKKQVKRAFQIVCGRLCNLTNGCLEGRFGL